MITKYEELSGDEFWKLDAYYENQRLFTEREGHPFFAPARCDHRYVWVDDDRYGNLQTFGEMMVEKYGEIEAFIKSSTELIISCPVCNKSWCD